MKLQSTLIGLFFIIILSIACIIATAAFITTKFTSFADANKQCKTQSDCNFGYVCSFGNCKAGIGTACSKDSDCSSLLLCNSNKCAAGVSSTVSKPTGIGKISKNVPEEISVIQKIIEKKQEQEQEQVVKSPKNSRIPEPEIQGKVQKINFQKILETSETSDTEENSVGETLTQPFDICSDLTEKEEESEHDNYITETLPNILDCCDFSSFELYLYHKEIVLKGTEEIRIVITIPLTRIFVFCGYLYGLCEKKLFLCDLNDTLDIIIFTKQDWIKEDIDYLSVSHDGNILSIESGNKRITYTSQYESKEIMKENQSRRNYGKDSTEYVDILDSVGTVYKQNSTIQEIKNIKDVALGYNGEIYSIPQHSPLSRISFVKYAAKFLQF